MTAAIGPGTAGTPGACWAGRLRAHSPRPGEVSRGSQEQRGRRRGHPPSRRRLRSVGRRRPLAATDSEPDGTAPAAGLSEDERAELERLRTEVTELRRRQADKPPRHRFSWRTPVAAVLIVIGDRKSV